MQTLKSLLHRNLYGQALKISTFLQNAKLTSTIYALFIKSDTLINPFQAASLITHFSHSGELSRASYLLRHTENPDIVVFNALISGYARYNQPRPAFELFNGLRQMGLNPDEVSFSSLIKCCDNLNLTEVVHSGFVKLGFGSNIFLISGLIENYSRYGCVSLAEKCFEECLGYDGVIWSVMINGYVRNGEFDKGRDCFMKMRREGFEFNEFCLTSVLGGVFDINEGEQIHGHCLKRGYLCGSSMHLNNALMVMYGGCGLKTNAVNLFDEMPDRDVVSWTGRIAVAIDCVEAFEIFKCCLLRGYEINEYTFINSLSPIEGAEMLKLGKQIHPIILKTGYSFMTSVCNALISMYTKSNQIHDARKVFDEMPHQDSASWNSLINGYSQHQLSNQAIEIFFKMRNSFLQPNEYTFATILEVSSNLKSLNFATQIHSLVLKLGYIFTNSILCRLITSYSKCNRIDKSRTIFNEIDRIEVLHVNAMSLAYDHCKCFSDVQTLFHERWNSGLDIDIITFSILLKSCGALSDLHQGKSLHSLAIKTGINSDKFINSAIIDVYSKCGTIDDAENVFLDAKNKNLVACNAMITGYAQYGCYNKAYDLFIKMDKLGMKPDEITYLGILTSCSHAKLANEAIYHLNSMFELHGVVPCLEHYACVVDVLGKVGQINEAKKTIDEMPVVPDARIWQILLSACKIHKNLEIGIVAARNIVGLEPENESSFVLLSNIYASGGMWSDVRELRREMRSKDVCKEPGFSWIQLKGNVHYFFANDKSHPQNEEIYMELQVLLKQMTRLPKEQDVFFTNFVT